MAVFDGAVVQGADERGAALRPDGSSAASGPPRMRQPSHLRLVDDTARVLEDAILSGQMRPGDRLVESRICDELGVSRTTVREALLMLARRGLIRSTPRRGTFVTRLSHRESTDLCVARALLEGYAVRIGYHRIDAAVIAEIERLIAEMAGCVLPRDVPRLSRIDLALHRLLVEGADMPRVRDLWASLDGQMSALFLTSLENKHASIDDVVAFHQRLLDAVRSGDVVVAQQGVIDHYVGCGAQFGGEVAAAGAAAIVDSVAAAHGAWSADTGVAENP